MTLLTTEILAHLVGFDTTSRNSNLPLIEWVEDYLARHGVASQRVLDATGAKANLWATIGPEDAAGYILSGHTDTVPVDDQAWSSDPFELTEIGDRLYGRGATDMKGFLAAALAKVPAMVEAPLVRPIHLAFSYDEEVGCVGVRPMIDRIGTLARVRPAGCFVGEPTSMQVVTAHKAKYSYRVTVNGKSCHSSLAPYGVNAIDAAAELVVAIRDIGRAMAVDGPADALFDIPVSTAHTGTIQGGSALNIVPDLCRFLFEFRLLPGLDPAAYLALLERRVAEKLLPEMQARDANTGIAIELTNGLPGFETAVDSDITRLAKRLAERNDHGKVAYGTEAGLFAQRGGIPTVVVGPGSIDQAHKPDEFIERAELRKCAAFLDRLIEQCCAPIA